MTKKLISVIAMCILAGCDREPNGVNDQINAENSQAQTETGNTSIVRPTASAPKMTMTKATAEMIAAKPPSAQGTLTREIIQCVRQSYGPQGPSAEQGPEVGKRIRDLLPQGQAGLNKCREGLSRN